MGTLALAVDGGNTKTLALVTTLDGAVRGTGRSGIGDIYASSPEPALRELERAIRQAMDEAGAAPADLACAGFSIAGADWPEDYAFLEAEMRRRVGPTTELVVVNDAIGALRAGTSDGQGVAVVCGTGAAIGARYGDRSWHSSFWGEDRGGLALGRATVRALVRSELGLGPPVGFAERALDVFGVTTVEDLLHVGTRRGAPYATFARLAPVVLDAAESGDPLAVRIVTESGRAIGEYTAAAARVVGLPPGSHALVLTGGILRHPNTLISAGIIGAMPGTRVVTDGYEPVIGALFLGLDRIGRSVDQEVLEGTLPPESWFASVEPRDTAMASA
jgi:N-acetylglucosamine kinase-like BadF-type ATPase